MEPKPSNSIPFLPCAHCAQTGRCNNEADGFSCHQCATKTRSKFNLLMSKRKNMTGVVCSVCSGLGVVEPYTYSLNNRIRPALAAGIIAGSIGILGGALQSEHFESILAFSTTIIGAVTGFYFGGSNDK